MSHVRPMGVPDDDRVAPITTAEPMVDLYHNAIEALLKLINHDCVTDQQAMQILDTMVSPLRGIRRRNQFLPLEDTGMTVDEAIAHFNRL